jgi:hypothetical protein
MTCMQAHTHVPEMQPLSPSPQQTLDCPTCMCLPPPHQACTFPAAPPPPARTFAPSSRPAGIGSMSVDASGVVPSTLGGTTNVEDVEPMGVGGVNGTLSPGDDDQQPGEPNRPMRHVTILTDREIVKETCWMWLRSHFVTPEYASNEIKTSKYNW